MARDAKDKRIVHHRSETSGVLPLASDLERAELFINLPDNELWTKDENDSLTQLNAAPPPQRVIADATGITLSESPTTAEMQNKRNTGGWTEAEIAHVTPLGYTHVYSNRLEGATYVVRELTVIPPTPPLSALPDPANFRKSTDAATHDGATVDILSAGVWQRYINGPTGTWQTITTGGSSVAGNSGADVEWVAAGATVSALPSQEKFAIVDTNSATTATADDGNGNTVNVVEITLSNATAEEQVVIVAGTGDQHLLINTNNIDGDVAPFGFTLLTAADVLTGVKFVSDAALKWHPLPLGGVADGSMTGAQIVAAIAAEADANLLTDTERIVALGLIPTNDKTGSAYTLTTADHHTANLIDEAPVLGPIALADVGKSLLLRNVSAGNITLPTANLDSTVVNKTFAPGESLWCHATGVDTWYVAGGSSA